MSDDVCLKVVELYLNEKKRGAAGGNLSSRCVRAARETSYQWKAERCMADENCFKVSSQPGSAPHEAGRRESAPPTGAQRPVQLSQDLWLWPQPRRPHRAGEVGTQQWSLREG